MIIGRGDPITNTTPRDLGPEDKGPIGPTGCTSVRNAVPRATVEDNISHGPETRHPLREAKCRCGFRHDCQEGILNSLKSTHQSTFRWILTPRLGWTDLACLLPPPMLRSIPDFIPQNHHLRRQLLPPNP